jgi:hypothetical protein
MEISMLVPIVPRFRKARRVRQRPPAARILSVTATADVEQVCVMLSLPVLSISAFDAAFELSVNGIQWLYPTEMDLTNPAAVVFGFGEDVTAATQWRVLTPDNWHFPGDATLGGVLGGAMP